MPEMIATESQAFTHYGYDSATRELHISFRNGTTHAYPVTPENYEKFLAAESKGRWFHQNIDKKTGRKIAG